MGRDGGFIDPKRTLRGSRRKWSWDWQAQMGMDAPPAIMRCGCPLPKADISFASTMRLCQHHPASPLTKRKMAMSEIFDGSTVAGLIRGEV
jgi:hypothetical protein